MKKLKEQKNNFIEGNIEDLLVVIAMLIIAINSIALNIIFGFYVVALELITIAYFISRTKKE